jgi:hypothetical protein
MSKSKNILLSKTLKKLLKLQQEESLKFTVRVFLKKSRDNKIWKLKEKE